jgi:hypothetical protein
LGVDVSISPRGDGLLDEAGDDLATDDLGLVEVVGD